MRILPQAGNPRACGCTRPRGLFHWLRTAETYLKRLADTMRTATALLALGLSSACSSTGIAPGALPTVAQASSADWQQDMARFAAEDVVAPPPRGAVLFIGSSSIRMWDTLASDFPHVPVINRGFGGSQIRDSTQYAGRIVVPYAPCHVILYAGDNDLHGGRSPLQLREDFRAFVSRLRRDLPRARISYISTKPSPARAELLDAQREANAMIAAQARRMRDVGFIDVFDPMLGDDGQPRESLFLADRLHLNESGYDLWRTLVGPHVRCP